MLILGSFGGVLADKISQKKVMVTLQVMNVCAVLPMVAILAMGSIEQWHVFISTFIIGTGWAIDFSTRRSYFTEILSKETVPNAVALDSAAFMASAMLGPLLGGSFVALFGFTWTYLIMGLLFICAGFLLFLLEDPVRPKSDNSGMSLINEIVGGVKIAKQNTIVWTVVVFTVVFNFFGFPYMQMVPVVAKEVLGVGSVGYGILGAFQGLGSLVGALIIANRGVVKEGRVFSLGGMLMLVCVFLFALSPIYSLSVLFVFLAGVGMSGFAIMQTAMVLKASPMETRGRAMGTVAMGIGVSPIGILIVGFLSERLGVQTALALLAIVGVIVVMFLRWRFPVLRDKGTG
jgi:MFS family permease